MLEKDFQKGLVKKLKEKFPGCIILKNDARLKPGIPDLLILYSNKWAALEVKRETKATHRGGQDPYVDRMSKMSYAAFICPENEEEVFRQLEEVFA